MGEEKSRQIVQLWVHTYNAIEKSFLLYKLKILKMHQCTNGTILIFDGREQTAENDTFQRVEGGIKASMYVAEQNGPYRYLIPRYIVQGSFAVSYLTRCYLQCLKIQYILYHRDFDQNEVRL